MKLLVKILSLTAYFYALTFSLPLYASHNLDTSRSEKTYLIASSFVGVKEEGNNSGYWVSRFLKVCGLKPGAQWCAAFVNFCLDSAGGKKSPFTGSGLARTFITKNKTIKASEVISNNMELPAGTIVVWRRGTTPFGHAGIVEKWKGKRGDTIEGNTSSGLKGSQHDGDGVWRRKREINPTSYFRITDFILVK